MRILGCFSCPKDVYRDTYLLESSLRADGGKIRAYKSMRLCSNLLQINIVSQLHVLSVDTQNLQSTSSIWDTNVNLTINPTGREREGGGGETIT